MANTTLDKAGAGALISGAVAASALMLHHPTSLHGPDDGQLLADWPNATVHGAMVVCLFAFALGGTALVKRLGRDRPTVVSGGLAFNGAIAAFVTAALINGFAMPAAPEAAGALRALNQTLATFGLLGMGLATGAFAVPMLTRGTMARLAAAPGLLMFVAAPVWALTSGGHFGLHAATASMGLFAIWALATGAWLLKEDTP